VKYQINHVIDKLILDTLQIAGRP